MTDRLQESGRRLRIAVAPLGVVHVVVIGRFVGHHLREDGVLRIHDAVPCRRTTLARLLPLAISFGRAAHGLGAYPSETRAIPEPSAGPREWLRSLGAGQVIAMSLLPLWWSRSESSRRLARSGCSCST